MDTQTAVATDFSEHDVLVADPPFVETHGEAHQLHCAVCQPDIYDLYDSSALYTRLTEDLTLMAARHPRGSKWFTSGRVVIIRDAVGVTFINFYFYLNDDHSTFLETSGCCLSL